MTKHKKTAPGYYWYLDDWRGDSGVQRLSYAAKGLWRDMLDLMVEVTPAGVLPGQLEDVAPLLGYSIPTVAKAWADEVRPMMRELEAAGVFSRGAELSDERDQLPSDSIVSRKIYRNWLTAERRRRKASHAADARWSVERDKKAVPTVPEIEGEKSPHNESEPMLGGMLGACSTECSAESVTNDTPTPCDDEVMLGECRSQTQTQTQTIYTHPQTQKRSTRVSQLTALSALDFGQLKPSDFDGDYSSLDVLCALVVEVAEGDGMTKGSWRGKLAAIDADAGLRAEFVADLDRIEKQKNEVIAKSQGSDMVKNAGAMLNSRITSLAHQAHQREVMA